LLFSLFCYSGVTLPLLSFPTRRSSDLQQFFQVYIISSSTVRTIAVSFVYDKGWTIQLFMSCEQQNIRIGFLLLSRLNHAISQYKGLNYLRKSCQITIRRYDIK